MNRPFLRLLTFALVVSCAMGTVFAAQPAEEEYDYRGHVIAIDQNARTLIVGSGKQKYSITTDRYTVVFVNDRESSLKEVRVGAAAVGTVKKRGSQLLAETVFVTDKK